MDPFSISTAVASLLGLTESIVLVLNDFVSNVQDAPNSAQQALFAVKDMGFALSSAQRLLSDLFALRSTRKAMVELDHLVVTITQSVITFKELEALICPETNSKSSLTDIRNRLKWAWKEEAVSRAVLRLEGHKSSLSLMLNILQCESDQEACVARQSLCNMMEQLLLQDEDMRRRLYRIENNQFLQRSSEISLDGDQSTIKAVSIKAPSVATSSTRTPTIINGLNSVLENCDDFAFPGGSFAVQQLLSFEREFEEVLQASGVYRRARLNECDASFASSVPLSHAWSALTGFSLEDISAISVIALPLDPDMIAAITAPSLPLLCHENNIMRHNLQLAQERCAELGIKTARLVFSSIDTPMEVKRKRSAVAALDRQHEIAVRDLEAMTEYLVRTKTIATSHHLNMEETKPTTPHDFALSLQELAGTLTRQNEELWQKRQRLLRQVEKLDQLEDEGFEEYEVLSFKNHQLTELNGEIIFNLTKRERAFLVRDQRKPRVDSGVYEIAAQ